jgi:hypothetical protein
MHAAVRSGWFRQCCFFLAAQLLGYLLAIELRDRYPQQICFVAVFCVITAFDELRLRRKRLCAQSAAPRAKIEPLTPRRSPGA